MARFYANSQSVARIPQPRPTAQLNECLANQTRAQKLWSSALPCLPDVASDLLKMAETQYKPPGLEAWDVVIVVLYFIVILGVGLYVSSSWHFLNNSAEREITCLACFSFCFENRVGNCWLLSAYIIILKHMYIVKVLVWSAEVLISCRLLLRILYVKGS